MKCRRQYTCIDHGFYIAESKKGVHQAAKDFARFPGRQGRLRVIDSHTPMTYPILVAFTHDSGVIQARSMPLENLANLFTLDKRAFRTLGNVGIAFTRTVDYPESYLRSIEGLGPKALRGILLMEQLRGYHRPNQAEPAITYNDAASPDEPEPPLDYAGWLNQVINDSRQQNTNHPPTRENDPITVR